MAEEKKNPLGPIGNHVRVSIERVRVERGLTKKQLSERVGELGRSVPPLGISRIEAGTRRVDADDLVALALALNVAPIALLMPVPDRGESYVRLTATQVAKSSKAWRWAKGETALPPDMDGEPDQEQQERYAQLSQSKRQRYMSLRPAGRAADVLIDDVYRAVEISQFTMPSSPNEFRDRLAAARASQERLTAELDRMEAEHARLVQGLEELQAKTEGGADGPSVD